MAAPQKENGMKRLQVALAMCCLVGSSAVAFAQGPGGGQNQNRIFGTLKEKGTGTISVQRMQQGGAGQAVTVTVNADTQYVKTTNGTAKDLEVGYLVVVSGQKEGNKITARRITRLSKIEGAVKDADWTAADAIAKTMTFGGRGGAQPVAPTVGQVSSADPLKIKTKAGEELEVAVTAAVTGQPMQGTRISLRSACKLDDLAVNSMVTIQVKEGGDANAPVATSVTTMPAMGGGRGGAGAGGGRGGAGGGAGGAGGAGGGNRGGRRGGNRAGGAGGAGGGGAAN